MIPSVDARCMVCHLIFCCADCRYKHERTEHGLTYNCPICRGYKYLCKPSELNEDFMKHLFDEHSPLHCSKCDKRFKNMEDFICIDDCTSITDLITLDEHTNSSNKAVDDKFDSLYEKVINNDEDNVEGIISVNKTNRTAVITPIVRKKYLVDYESSDSEEESIKPEEIQTPHLESARKNTKLLRQRVATPHVKKFLRQNNVEEYDKIDDNITQLSESDKTPSRVEYKADLLKEMTTPTTHLGQLLQTVTTSTPTHPPTGGWSLFPDPGADSPLSEIENSGTSAQNINNEQSKTESEVLPPKLKSIIITNSRIRLGSQDSSEKHVTFQESTSNTDASSIKTKKVKFAEDTVFDQGPKTKRVYRKPRRMLTPGPQKQRFCFNPRFQALVNRFENRGLIMARTPTTNREIVPETTPQGGDPTSISARAINFKDSSPIIENNSSTDSNECYKTCIASPEPNIDSAITAFSANIAGTLQNCLTSVLRTTEEETEIQFKFTITKKKVTIKKIIEQAEGVDERSSEIDRNVGTSKENIWSCVARAVRNVFWGDQGNLSEWILGLPAFVCDVYIAMDVTSSTSSIFNLVAISVDRYIAVTQPIKYAKHKNNRRVWFTIVLVWLISAAIGAPIVLGLNDTPDRNFDECLFNSQNYIIYSSMGSFYIPCIMMMFLYYNIFKALRNRAKKQRAAKKPPVSGDPVTGPTAAVVIENVAETRRLAETALHEDRPTNTGSGSNEDDHDDSFDKRSGDLEADVDECHVIPNDKSTEFMLATVAEETNNTPKKHMKSQPIHDPNGNNDSGYAPSNLEETIREHVSPPGSPSLKDATVLKNISCEGSKWKKNGKTAKLNDSRNVSLALRSEDDLEASTFDLRDGSNNKKERKASAATARFTIYKANKASKKKREKSSAKKERKATKTLAIVLGVFLFCWAPFFTCSVLGAICDKFNLLFSPGVTVFILTTWLGYINSFLNPVIYTIFNPEFRKAFRKILHCGT